MNLGHLSAQLLAGVLQVFTREQHRLTDIYTRARSDITRAGFCRRRKGKQPLIHSPPFNLRTSSRKRSSLSSNRMSRKTWIPFASIKMRGFRVGLEGQSSVVYLECSDVRGEIDQNAFAAWCI
jgi:hypothetical protein